MDVRHVQSGTERTDHVLEWLGVTDDCFKLTRRLSTGSWAS